MQPAWCQDRFCLTLSVRTTVLRTMQAFTLRAWLAGLGERRADTLAAVWALMADGTLKPYSGKRTWLATHNGSAAKCARP